MIDRAEQSGTTEELATASYNIGVFHIAALTGFSKSIPPLLRALSLFEEVKDSAGVSKCYMQLGLIGYITQYFEDAIKNFNLSLQYAENHTSTYLMAITLTEMGEYEEAKQHFLKAIKAFQKGEYEKRVSECYMYLGKLYQDQGIMDSAHYYLALALERLTQLETKIELGRPYALLSSYFLKANKIDSAKTYALQALDSLGSRNDQLSAMTASGVLSEVYEIEKDYEKAHHYLKMYYELKYDNVQGSTKQKIAELQSVFEFQREMAEENLKHQDELRQKNRTKNIYLISGLFVLVISGGLWSRLNIMKRSRIELQTEKNISENLLLNILPQEIAIELKTKGKAEAKNFSLTSILFSDFVEFTKQSENLSANELISEINYFFEGFDQIMEKYGVEKIKTIGNAYMAAGGLPVPADDSVKRTVLAALEMQAFILNRKTEMDAAGKPAFEMRVGIHTGPVVAGIVGVKKFQYDIWGDTVNTASRMESSGEVGKVNISQSTYELLKDDPDFVFESRGRIEVKGKGEMEMYFVSKKV